MTYKDGAPAHYASGTRDESSVTLYPVQKSIKHTQPLFLLQTPKGGYEEEEVVGGEVTKIYGFDAVNPTSKYFNHQARLTLESIGLGVQSSIRRMPFIPFESSPDEDGIANITLYANITTVSTAKKLKRDGLTGMVETSNGDYLLDNTSADIPVKYYELSSKKHTNDELNAGLGVKTTTGGFIVDGVAHDVKSYPIVTLKAYAHGDFYNNIGFTIYPLLGDDTDYDMVSKSLNLPFAFGMVDKSSGKVVNLDNIDSEKTVTFTFDPVASHPVTAQTRTFEDLVPSKFGNITNQDYPIIPFEINEPILYRDNIELLSKELLKDEITVGAGSILPYVDYSNPTVADIDMTVDKELYLSNLLTLKHSTEAAYESVRPSNLIQYSVELKALIGDKVNPTKDTPFYLSGGNDGDITNVDKYELNVLAALEDYANPDSEYTHLGLSRISEFVDTGFKMATKLKLGVFNSYRKDVRLIGATAEVTDDNKPVSMSTHISRAAILEAMYSMSIESAEHNTPGFRTCILIGSGKDKKGLYRSRLPLSYDFAIKNFKMFKGNSWNSVYEFSTQPNNRIDTLVDVSPRFMPKSLKSKSWNLGIIWPDSEDRQTTYYPQMQTIYPDDTSVLNSWYSAVAVCFIEKKLEETHRKRSGDMTSTPTELSAKLTEDLTIGLTGKFSNIIVPAVEVFKTKRDESAGYAATARVDMFAPNMFTVLSSSIVALRKV